MGSIFVFGPGRSGQPDDAPALLPAVSGTPAAGTPMLELTLDDLRPFRAVGGLGVTNYPPGGGSQLRTGRESSDVFHVAAGPLTLRVVQASVPVRVDLAGTGVQGTFDATLGADEELILATGATVVMPPSAEIVLSNTGSRPARMLELLFSADSPLRPTGDATFEGPWGSKGHDVAAPVTIRLEQRVLAPGDQLPAATTPNTYQSAAVFEATRRMDLRFDPDGTIRNGGASPLGVYVLLVRTGSDGETVTSAPPAGT